MSNEIIEHEILIDPTRSMTNAYDCSCGGPVDFDWATWRWHCAAEDAAESAEDRV